MYRVTAAGRFSGLSSSMNGTKKLPHMDTKVKIVATARPDFISGITTDHSARYTPAPSVQALSSISTGTPSMNPLVRKMAYGRELAPRNRIAPNIESIRFTRTNRAYTGIMIAVIGRPVEKMIVSIRAGRISGIWIERATRKELAPSIFAASYSSPGMALSCATMISML